MTQHIKSTKQQEIAASLATEYGIDPERILFLNPRNQNEPWIPPTLLETIARAFDDYRSSSVAHDKFIPETAEVIYIATVTDSKNRIFSRSGVATIGEGNAVGDEIDANILAQGRALSAALNAAGFNPVKSAPMVDFNVETAYENQPKQQFAVEDEAMLRTKDLKHIHALATDKGLIVGKDDTDYRVWLTQHFGVKTSAILSPTDRQRVINKLRTYADDYSDVPSELREEAMFA